MVRQAVVLAGGKGTRLRERLAGRPKPLVDVLGMPLLERQVLALRDAGVNQILILVNHLAEQIESFCAARSRWGIDVQLIDDGEPLGTAGAVLSVIEKLDEEFLVVYGDTLFDIDFERFLAFHAQDSNAAATLFLHPNDHPADSDIVVVGTQNLITAFCGYPHPDRVWLPNMVNAALYIVRRWGLETAAEWQVLEKPRDGLFDFAKHLFPLMLARGCRLRGYVSPEYIKDIGTPDRLDRACAALASGSVARASLKQLQKAVFLDRDGTLNAPNGHISSPDGLHVYKQAASALRTLHDHEYRTVLVTNQPVLARGDCSEDQLRQIHAKLETLLGAEGAFLDGIYFCPHHPDAGFAGEVAELKVVCTCRKPEPGMLWRAGAELNIDLAQSWMIGDSTADLMAARRAGVTSILVETGEAGRDGKYAVLPDFSFSDVLEAAQFVTQDYDRWRALASVQHVLRSMRPGEDWFVTGLARSGKSTLCAVLARELRATGRDCVVVSTDRWIFPEAERRPGFTGRHDSEEMQKSFALSLQRHGRGPVFLTLPIYDRDLRSSVTAAEPVALGPETIVLWDGVGASLLVPDEGLHSMSVFVAANEEARCERVIADLVKRGSSPSDARAICDDRRRDENPLVTAALDRCRFRVSTDDVFASQAFELT